MEAIFTVHVTDWRGGGNFYIVEKKSGRHVGLFFGAPRRKAIELLKNNINDAFDYVFDVPGEPNPIPTFVDHYELKLYGCSMGVVAHLTEKGVMRKALESGRRLPRQTPFGPMYF